MNSPLSLEAEDKIIFSNSSIVDSHLDVEIFRTLSKSKITKDSFDLKLYF